MTGGMLPAETDVVVVGAGMAGFCAALEAAAQGARVLLIEKEDKIGGSSILSGGSFAFAGTAQQAAAGIADDGETLFDDLRRVGGFRNDESLVRVFVEEQLATQAWLAGHGLAFGPPQLAAGQSVPRTHRSSPRAMFERLGDAAARTPGLRFVAGAAGRRLARDGASGAVSGILVEQAGAMHPVAARRGVVLATGGFMRNEALLANFAPSQERALRMGGPGCTGDGLRMAWALGADLRDMGFIKGTFGCHPSAGGEDHFMLLSLYAGAIAVNREGRRFVDESLSYKLIGDACLQQPDALGFQVFDQGVMERSVPDGSSFDFAAELRAGRLVEAPSLPALAVRLGIDGAALAQTVAAYNEDVATGRDRAFGRRSLSSGWGRLVPLTRPPFYAYPSRSVVIGTYCGLVVDRETRVHDVFGAAIPGLYAAGQIMGGFHGVAYMTGTALSKAAVFGRIAGRAAARGAG